MAKQTNFFEDALKRLEIIEQMSDEKAQNKAEEEFYDSFNGWEYELFIKYHAAKQRANDFIDFNDCPSEEHISSLVDCLRNHGVQYITISSGWSKTVEKMWAFQVAGCKLDGMIEINSEAPNRKTGMYSKRPAFLLSISPATKQITRISELAAGAEAANSHCVFDTNRMNGFVYGLNAAMEILNAESDEQAIAIAAKHRKKMASITCTSQENWFVDGIAPDENWIVK